MAVVVGVAGALFPVPAACFCQDITNAKDKLLRMNIALDMLRKDEEDDRERAKAYEQGKAEHVAKAPTAQEERAEATLQALSIRKADIGKQKHHLETSLIPGLQQKLRDFVRERRSTPGEEGGFPAVVIAR